MVADRQLTATLATENLMVQEPDRYILVQIFHTHCMLIKVNLYQQLIKGH